MARTKHQKIRGKTNPSVQMTEIMSSQYSQQSNQPLAEDEDYPEYIEEVPGDNNNNDEDGDFDDLEPPAPKQAKSHETPPVPVANKTPPVITGDLYGFQSSSSTCPSGAGPSKHSMDPSGLFRVPSLKRPSFSTAHTSTQIMNDGIVSNGNRSTLSEASTSKSNIMVKSEKVTSVDDNRISQKEDKKPSPPVMNKSIVSYDSSVRKYKQEKLQVVKKIPAKSLEEINTVSVFFVRQGNHPTKYMQTCFSMIVSQNYLARESLDWISEEKLMERLNGTERPFVLGIYVLEDFEKSTIFNELLKRSDEDDRCRICGPIAILQMVNDKAVFPKQKEPLISLSFDKVIICATDYKTDDRIQMEHMIIRMGGKFSHGFKRGVTHLIAKTITSRKSIIARSQGLPIMTKEWLEAIWTQTLKQELVKAKDPNYIKRFRIPIFAGATFCVSQVNIYYML